MKVFLRYFLIFLLILQFLVLTYLPALSIPYAERDDYVFFWGPQKEDFYVERDFVMGYSKPFVGSGRFVQQILQYYVYEPVVNSIADLNIIRFFSIFNLSVSAFLLFLWLSRFISPSMSFFLSVSIFTLPAFEVIATYALMIFVGQGILFSSVAAWCAVRSSKIKSAFKHLLNPWTIGAIVLMILSISTYQTSGMFFWVYVAVLVLFGEKQRFEDILCQVRNFFVIGFAAMGIYLSVLERMKGVFIPDELHFYSPYFLSPDWLGKVIWFMKIVLPNTLNYWNVFPVTLTAWICTYVISVAFIYFYLLNKDYYLTQKRVAPVVFKVLIIPALIFLSYMPNIVSFANFPWYRTFLALGTLMLLFLFWAIRAFVVHLIHAHREKILTLVCASFCLWGMLHASMNILYYRCIPSYIEVEYLKSVFLKTDLHKTEKIIFVLSKPFWKAVENRHDEEFLFLSLRYKDKFVAKKLVKCIMNEVGYDASHMSKLDGGIRYADNKHDRRNRYFHYLRVYFLDWDEYKLLSPISNSLVIDVSAIYPFLEKVIF